MLLVFLSPLYYRPSSFRQRLLIVILLPLTFLFLPWLRVWARVTAATHSWTRSAQGLLVAADEIKGKPPPDPAADPTLGVQQGDGGVVRQQSHLRLHHYIFIATNFLFTNMIIIVE